MSTAADELERPCPGRTLRAPEDAARNVKFQSPPGLTRKGSLKPSRNLVRCRVPMHMNHTNVNGLPRWSPVDDVMDHFAPGPADKRKCA